MAHPFLVAIPSYRRPTIVLQKTIPFCLDVLGVPSASIYLFLAADDPDVSHYVDNIGQLPYGAQIHIQLGPAGLHHMRNEMSRFFAGLAAEAGATIRVLYLDDDIDHMVRMVVRPDLPLKSSARYVLERVPGPELAAAIGSAFAGLEARGLDLFGFYPVANGYFMKDLPEETYDLRFCVGAAYGMLHRPGEPPYVLELEEKEDFERTLLCYERRGGVLRLNRLAPITQYYKTGGGLQARGYDRKEAAAASCQRLIARFPTLCRPYAGKKNGMPEVRLITRKKCKNKE